MIYILNGNDITNSQFAIGGINYPSNWCQLSNNTELTSLGIITLTETYPTLGTNQYYDGTYIDIVTGNTPQRIYNVSNETIDMINMPINQQINALKNQQTQLITNVILNISGAQALLQDNQNQILALQSTLITTGSTN